MKPFIQPLQRFWRSVDLTGNQTPAHTMRRASVFWRSVDLTGNQTTLARVELVVRFGAVSI